MTTIIEGKSAKGKTRLLIGPYYSLSFSGWDIKEIETTPTRVPPELAWTEMNTSWKNGGRR